MAPPCLCRPKEETYQPSLPYLPSLPFDVSHPFLHYYLCPHISPFPFLPPRQPHICNPTRSVFAYHLQHLGRSLGLACTPAIHSCLRSSRPFPSAATFICLRTTAIWCNSSHSRPGQSLDLNLFSSPSPPYTRTRTCCRPRRPLPARSSLHGAPTRSRSSSYGPESGPSPSCSSCTPMSLIPISSPTQTHTHTQAQHFCTLDLPQHAARSLTRRV